MPTYEYVCEKCEKHFDIFQSMNDPRLETCPDESCGGNVKRKIGTGAGIIFKGSGFYQTDYRSDSYKAAQKKDSAPAADSGGSGSDKSEKKTSGEKTAAKTSSPDSGSKGKASGSSTSKAADA